MAAPISLQITIVGAGLGGLAAATCLAQRGHQVQVIESNNGLSELGAGIQVPPNAMRILDSWGLKSILYQEGNASGGATVRRYEDGKVIGIYRGNAKELYGYQ
jgi:salicylate hydroxylase